MSLRKMLDEVKLAFQPDIIVGCKYHFRTIYNGKPLAVEGIITHFSYRKNGMLRYGISAPKNLKIQVIGLVKVDGVWFVQFAGDTFVINLGGSFTLV